MTRGGKVTTAGCQVTILCDPIRHVIYYSGEVISTNSYIYDLLTYLLTFSQIDTTHKCKLSAHAFIVV